MLNFLALTFSMNEQWSAGCQSSVYVITLNGTVSINSFIHGTTSAASCLASQFLNANEPSIKSFCTSTITSDERGNKVYCEFFLDKELKTRKKTKIYWFGYFKPKVFEIAQ